MASYYEKHKEYFRKKYLENREKILSERAKERRNKVKPEKLGTFETDFLLYGSMSYIKIHKEAEKIRNFRK